MPPIPLQTSLWETVKCDLKGLFPEDVFQMWFQPMTCVEAGEDSITLGVPNDFAAIWIHDNYLDLISQRLRMAAGRLVNVTLKKLEAAASVASSSRAPMGDSRTKPAVAKRPAVRYDERSLAASSLNPRNTFETFVVGANNQLA